MEKVKELIENLEYFIKEHYKLILPIVGLIVILFIIVFNTKGNSSNTVVKNENNEVETAHMTVVKAYELNDKDKYDEYEVIRYNFSTDVLYSVHKNGKEIQSSKICNFKNELANDKDVNEIEKLDFNEFKLSDYLISANTYELDREGTYKYISKNLNSGSRLVRLIETDKFIDCYLQDADGSYLRIVNNSEVTMTRRLDNIDTLRDIIEYIL